MAAEGALGQEVIHVEDSSCPACRIEMVRIATLGAPDDPIQPRANAQVARDEAGRFFVAPLFEPGKIAIYDTEGFHARTIGQLGEGPGEFGYRINHLVFGDSGALHVLEINRYTVLAGGTMEPVATRILEFVPLSAISGSDGQLIVQHQMMTNEGDHLVHLMRPDGEILRSLVPAPRGTGQGNPREQVRAIAWAGDGRIWVASTLAYRLELWSLEGGLLRVLEREAAFFEPWRVYDRREPFEKAPRPVLRSVHQSPDDRLLWVSVNVADENWKPAPPAAERRVGDIDLSEFWDTIIEVVDLDKMAVVARAKMDERLSPFVGPDGFVYSPREDDDTVVIDVWQPRLIR